MGIAWKDVSVSMVPDMTVWPGDGTVSMRATTRVAEGAPSNVSEVTFSTHTGTHVDAPWHFIDDGKRLDGVDPAVFFGEARVYGFSELAVIGAEDFGEDPLPERILIKTRASHWSYEEAFREDFTALDPTAAQRLVDEGVKLVGIDYLSIEPFDQADCPTHHILLGNEVFIVEGLRLADVVPGTYPFTVLPLPLVGVDGAPARAFLGMPGTA
jgi:arylformamidase